MSPTLIFLTSSPTAITSPAASDPDTCGNGTGTGAPLIPQISLKFIAVDLTSKITSSAFGFGSSISWTLSILAKLSSGAYSVYTTAFMTNPILDP